MENRKNTFMGTSGFWPQLKYHAKQFALWTTKKRIIYAPCGRGSGKTELALRRLIRMLPVKKPWDDPVYAFGAPTFDQAKRIAWHKLIKLCPPQWITDINNTNLSIKTVFGSELFLVGLDKPQRIEGIQIDGIVVDENCDIKPGTIDLNVLPILTWRSGWLWRIGVPKRFGPGAVEYRERFLAAAKGELPDSAGFTWPSSDVVPKELLELAKATMDIRDYQEQFEASWLTASGGIFHAFDREYNVRPCSYHPDKPIIVGSDFNVDPMCWVLCHEHDGILEVFDEIFLRNTNTPATLETLCSRYASHKAGFQFYGDASAKSRHASAYQSDYVHILADSRFRAMGRTIHYLHANPPIADRFAASNARICDGTGQRHVFVDPRCKHLILDLETRAYKPSSREAADSGDIGHSTDALGYIIYKKWPLSFALPNKQVITIAKSVA